MIADALRRLVDRESLTRTEMATTMEEVADGKVTPAQLGALLLGLRLKGETAEELTGAAQVMRSRLHRVKVDQKVFIDTCGTGGDGANTFNLSTAAAFVVAAAGVTVAKHGNRSVSSKCGSADVLEALGVRVTSDLGFAERCIEQLGIGFLFAPHHHPAFKAAAGVRRELGVRTMFNLLGPLSNPAGAQHQVIGVFASHWVPVVGEVLRSLGAVHTLVVHGSGLDEISLSGPTRVCELKGGELREYSLTPEELGLPRCALEQLAGGDAAVNARILKDIFDGQRGPPRDAVLANAAAGLIVGEAVTDWREAVEKAAAAIDGGGAALKLEALVKLTSGGGAPS